LQVGEIPEDAEPADPATLQTRLSAVVSQIAMMAGVMGALKVGVTDRGSGLTVDIGEAGARQKSSADTAA
jgi:hypothetical protein